MRRCNTPKGTLGQANCHFHRGVCAVHMTVENESPANHADDFRTDLHGSEVRFRSRLSGNIAQLVEAERLAVQLRRACLQYTI